MTATVLLSDLQSRGFLVSVVDDGILVKPSKFLTDDDRQAIGEHKSELLELLNSRHLCPGCAGEMRLQDRARDTWWCPACRRWADGEGNPLAGAAAPKTIGGDPNDGRKLIAYDPEESRKLLEDLRAAGCVFVLDGDELRLRYPSRMSAGLWSRFQSAGGSFIKLVRETAEREALCSD